MELKEAVDSFYNGMKKMKHPIFNVDKLGGKVKEILDIDIPTEALLILKRNIMEDDRFILWKSGTYTNDEKFYHVSGDWISIKGVYKNPIEGKWKIGLQVWEK